MGTRIFLALIGAIALLQVSCRQEVREIDLSGEWEVSLDSLDKGIDGKWYETTFSDRILLPGTLCDAGYGTPCQLEPKMEKEIFLNLKAKFSYVGPAWYRKVCEVPEEWNGKTILLTLERVLWSSQLWVNGTQVEGSQESLTTPHCFDLSKYLIPGQKNSIVVRVDNRKQYDISVKNLAHAYTNDTQTMWNGVLGEIKLTAKDRVRIDELRLVPDVDNRLVKVTVKMTNHTTASVSGKLRLSVEDPHGNQLPAKEFEIEDTEVIFYYPLDQQMLWDEFHPNLYKATATIEVGEMTDSKSEVFGLRKLTNKGALLQINDRRLFLRGTLECCIFPLTGYPPTDEKGWEKVFETARDYGLNHLRFHSWCPPEAAFRVADKMGFYLQVELPLWELHVGEDLKTADFLRDEANRILKKYGNHPSFCFWSMGNELEGDFAFLDELMTSLRKQDPRHLYTTTSFTFQKGHGAWPEPHDDFWVTQWTQKGWVRGQGVFDSEPVSFNKDYSGSIEGLPAPLVTHEIGQYSVFPNLKEVDKYTGNLLPLNFRAVAEDLRQKGRLPLAEDYLIASGKLAVLLYKEEIERALKTPGFSGFQLLDLHDFPGQGTALVGVIDAFWESKGLITPEEFRQFCSPVVPLARFEKATYRNNETLNVSFEVANFSEGALNQIEPEWQLVNSKGEVMAQGKLSKQDIPVGNAIRLGDASISLKSVSIADQLTLSIRLGGTGYQNSWSVWAYPAALPEAGSGVLYTQSFAEAEKALNEGKKVLLNPVKEEINGLEGKFVQVFWSPVHFPNQPGTMGVLCDPAHPALADFPTEMHSNWQWWDICKHATVMQLDSLQNNLQPVVRMVDNFYKNRNLGLIMEAKVGNGSLLVCSSDLEADLDARPVAKQLRYSLLKYMEGDRFQPKDEILFQQIEEVLHNKTRKKTEKRSIYE